MNWETKTLEQLFEKGSSKLTLKAVKDSAGPFKVFGAKGLCGYSNQYDQERPYFAVIKDGAGVGRISCHEPKSSVLGTMQYLIPRGQENFRFLHYALLNLNLSSFAVGSTIPHIYFKDYKNSKVGVPTLDEQERIVEVLDEAFASIDMAKANVERNLTNARELVQSRLNEIFSNPSEGWNEVRLPEVVSESCSLSYGIVQPGSDKPQGLPIVRPKDMRVKFIGAEGLKKVDPSVAESYQRTSLQGGELLLCVRGETGLVSIASKELNGANVTRGIVPVGFDDSIVDLEFGYYQFLSPSLKRQVKDKTYGSTLQQINIRDVKTLSLSLPPLSTQKGIADDMQKLDLFTDSLTAHYIKELDNLEELRQSILEQAFEGKLAEPVAA